MSNVDNFKSFVRKNPTLVTFVRNGTMSWQKFYEMYDMYGENSEVWDSYLETKAAETAVAAASFSDIVTWIKGINLDKNLSDLIFAISSSLCALSRINLGL